MVERNFRSPSKGSRELTIGIASTEDLEIAISYHLKAGNGSRYPRVAHRRREWLVRWISIHWRSCVKSTTARNVAWDECVRFLQKQKTPDLAPGV